MIISGHSPPPPADSFPHSFPEALGLTSNFSTTVFAVLVGLGLLSLSLSQRSFRQQCGDIFWAVVIGLTILFVWLATRFIGAQSFDPIPHQSFSFSMSIGQTLIYVMTWSGATINCSIAACFGVVVGAFVGARVLDEFRWDANDDHKEMRRHFAGAFLMGVGGVLAGGCTIGQGFSAASQLSISAPVVMASIWFGAWLTLSYLIEGTLAGPLMRLLKWGRDRTT